jgi:hypothetical protein
MHLPAYDNSKEQFDRYRQFYCGYTSHYTPQFVQFKTGEMILTTHQYMRDTEARKHYTEYGIEIRSTLDSKLPDMTTVDGRLITGLDFNHASTQIIAIDHDSHRCVALEYLDRNPKERLASTMLRAVPKWLRGYARAYQAGPGEPLVGSCIMTAGPRKHTKEEKRLMADLKTACVAWWKMSEAEGMDRATSRALLHGVRAKCERVSDRPMASNMVLTGLTPAELMAEIDDGDKYRIANYGYRAEIISEWHDHLLLPKTLTMTANPAII